MNLNEVTPNLGSFICTQKYEIICIGTPGNGILPNNYYTGYIHK